MNDADEQNGLLGTKMQWEWVERELSKALGTDAKFGKNKSITRIGTGQGFVSIMGRILTDWTIKRSDLPESVIIKMPTIANFESVSRNNYYPKGEDNAGDCLHSAGLKQLEDLIPTIHSAEVSFYRMVQKHNLNIRVPKCFVLEEFSDHLDQAAIIMEDLGTDAHIIPIFNSVSPEELLQVFETIADVHAFSLRNDEWKNLKMTKFSEQANIDDLSKLMRDLAKPCLDVDPPKVAPLLEKYYKHFDQICDVNLIDEICDKMEITPVLAHGDLWSANVMWKKEGEKNKLVAVIDWQIIHLGCPAEDLSRLMFSSLTAKDRREKWEYLLRGYYDMLKSKLGRDPPFDFEKLKACFLKMLPIAGAMVVPVFGLIALQCPKNGDGDLNKDTMDVLREKVLGTLEDIIFYHEQNELAA